MYSTFSVVVVAVMLGFSVSVDAQKIDCINDEQSLIGIGPISFTISKLEA